MPGENDVEKVERAWEKDLELVEYQPSSLTFKVLNNTLSS